MKLKTLISLLFLVTVQLSFSQSSEAYKQLDRSGKKFVNLAEKLVSMGDYKNAMERYKDALHTNQDNAEVIYRIGELHYLKKEYPLASQWIERALVKDSLIDPKANYILGMSYLNMENLDIAEKKIKKHLDKTDKKTLEYDEVLETYNSILVARELMQTPLKVKIENVGENINSKFPEYSPSLTLDGKFMIFTSRRAAGKSGKLTDEDRQFYEDVFQSEWDEKTKKWSEAKLIPGKVNTEGHDASLSISPDGSKIFLYKNIPKETKSGDIYYSTLNMQGTWTAPKPVETDINTSYFESSASLSADGEYLYFVSESRDGFGEGDIYRAKKTGKNTFGEIKNLGGIVNSPKDEISCFIHPDGKTLFFSSKGHQNMGGYDIFKTVWDEGSEQWSTPQNIGYPINTTGDDVHFVLSLNGKIAHYSAIRKEGFGDRDIYTIEFLDDVITQASEVVINDNPKKSNLGIFKGRVQIFGTEGPHEATLAIVDASNQKLVALINTDESGNFMTSISSTKEFVITIKSDGFDPITDRIKFDINDDEKLIFKTYTFKKSSSNDVEMPKTK